MVLHFRTQFEQKLQLLQHGTRVGEFGEVFATKRQVGGYLLGIVGDIVDVVGQSCQLLFHIIEPGRHLHQTPPRLAHHVLHVLQTRSPDSMSNHLADCLGGRDEFVVVLVDKRLHLAIQRLDLLVQLLFLFHQLRQVLLFQQLSYTVVSTIRQPNARRLPC